MQCRDGRTREAIALMESVVSASSNEVAHTQLGTLYAAEGNLQKASEHFNVALQLVPGRLHSLALESMYPAFAHTHRAPRTLPPPNDPQATRPRWPDSTTSACAPTCTKKTCDAADWTYP